MSSCYSGVSSIALIMLFFFFFFNDPATTEIYTLSLHDALPIYLPLPGWRGPCSPPAPLIMPRARRPRTQRKRSEEHTSELQSRGHLVCRLLLEKKKKNKIKSSYNMTNP